MWHTEGTEGQTQKCNLILLVLCCVAAEVVRFLLKKVKELFPPSAKNPIIHQGLGICKLITIGTGGIIKVGKGPYISTISFKTFCFILLFNIFIYAKDNIKPSGIKCSLFLIILINITKILNIFRLDDCKG